MCYRIPDPFHGFIKWIRILPNEGDPGGSTTLFLSFEWKRFKNLIFVNWLTGWLVAENFSRFSVIKYNLIMYWLGPLWSCCGLEGAHREDWREDWRKSFNRSPDQEDLPRRGRRTDKRNSSHSKYGLLINGLDVNTYAWVMISWRIQGSLIKVGFGGYQEHLFLFINNFKVIVSVKSR